MARSKKYRLNRETLVYEVVKDPRHRRLWSFLAFLLVSAALYVLYFWIYAFVLGLPQPKSLILERRNAGWAARYEMMNSRMDGYEQSLHSLAQRDDDVYRSVFGMMEIPQEVRNSGIRGAGSEERYRNLPDSSLLRSTVVRMDRLTKQAYIQSKSFDEVLALALKAGDMTLCVPSICPMYPDDKIRYASSFGYRIDPKWGGLARHTGIDLATDIGNPVYATGNGTVEEVVNGVRGYGKYVVIDHGFGYKTRYAHLHNIVVVRGQEVKRGQHIAYSGNSGKSTGPHLHYEVMYRNNYVNPINYLDLEIPLPDYENMVTIVPREEGTTGRSKRW